MNLNATVGNTVAAGEIDRPTSGVGPDLLARLSISAPSLPRLLVIFAHPDDEVLATGAQLERLSQSRLLCVTDGAPEDGHDARAHGFATLDAYREARRAELQTALRLGGLPEGCAHPLLLPQPDGSQRSLPDQTAALHLAELTRAVSGEIELYRPEAILTHPYEGGHPDHDSCAFAVHTAVSLLHPTPAPVILEAPFYHAGPNGIETGEFLNEIRPASATRAPSAIFDLSLEQQARKRRLLECFVTQSETLNQFRTEREQFRIAPAYDFAQAPHAGPLFYESFPWRFTGKRFRELVAAAIEELDAPKVSHRSALDDADDV